MVYLYYVCLEGQKSLVGTQATDFCSTVCDRLVYVVSACSELVQTSISPGPTTDGMFKVIVIVKKLLLIIFQLRYKCMFRAVSCNNFFI